MAKKSHMKNSRKSGSAKSTAKRRAVQVSKKAEADRHAEKANAHLLKAWQIMYEIRTGKRKAKEPSLKWLKSLMTRTSL